MTARDPPLERLFCEDFNGGFYLKGEIFILEKLGRNVCETGWSRKRGASQHLLLIGILVINSSNRSAPELGSRRNPDF